MRCESSATRHRIDMGRDHRDATGRGEARRGVQRAPRHPGEDGTVQGLMDLMGPGLYPFGMATSVIAIDKELTKQVLVPHGIRMPADNRDDARACISGDPLPRPYVRQAGQRRLVVGVAIVTADGNYGNPIARDADGPWQPSPAARRALHPGPRADRRGARRPGAVRDRTEAQAASTIMTLNIPMADRAYLPGRLPATSLQPRWTLRSTLTSCSDAKARRAPISAGTTIRATGIICSR